jgi:hypothetical protein
MKGHPAAVLFVLASLAIASSGRAAPLAATSFEVAEGYPAPPPAYDVRSSTLTLTDGAGWGGNTWAGNNGGSAYTYVAADATAYDGDQYLVMHREKAGTENREILLRRKFDTSLIQDQRMILSLAFRLDAVRTAANYFGSSFNIYLEKATSSNLGDENVRLEFTKEGYVKVRENGTSTIVGYWYEPGTFYALNSWATVTLDVDLAAQRADFYMNGTWVGNYQFNKTLAAGTTVDQIRFKGPQAYDGSPNDGASVDAISLTTGLDEPVPGCKSSVRPGAPVSAVANIGEPADPTSVAYTILNIGSVSLDYTVTEVDSSGAPAEYGWLAPDKTAGTVASLGQDIVTVSIDTTGLAGGNYTGFIKIADNCNPQGSQIRRIDLTVIACEWTVDSCNQVRVYNLEYPQAPVEPVTYRVTNTGLHPFSYTVAKSGDNCFEWLTLTGDTGTLNPGEHADVVATIHPEALVGQPTDNSYSCDLLFTDNCSVQTVTRTVRIRYLGPGDTQVFGYNGNANPEDEDAAGPGIKFRVAEGEGVANGAVEMDNDAADGQAWRMIDPSGQKTKYQTVYWREATQTWEELDIRGEAGATILGRLRVRSWGPTSDEGKRDGGLFVWEPDSISATLHWGGATDGVLMEKERTGARVTLTPTDEYLTFRMTVIGRKDDAWDCGRTVRIYVNENPTPVLELLSAGEEGNSTKEGFGFGAGSTDGTYDIAFDWIAGTNAGAFAPGEEVAVIGRSLIPSMCPRPFADADEDGDVDQADFSRWQTCFTGSAPPTGAYDRLNCHCFDRDKDSDVDADDLGKFERCASGPAILADPACGDAP